VDAYYADAQRDLTPLRGGHSDVYGDDDAGGAEAASPQRGGPRVTPQQLRVARLASTQQEYEDALAAARRQAFQERLQLQAKFAGGRM
jgi:hypothetical protein